MEEGTFTTIAPTALLTLMLTLVGLLLLQRTTTGRILWAQRPLRFAELPRLLSPFEKVTIEDVHDEEEVPNLIVARHILGEFGSIIYYCSQHPKGVIETLEVLAADTGHCFLKYESGTCVGFSRIRPYRHLRRLPTPEAIHHADLFGDKVRALVTH